MVRHRKSCASSAARRFEVVDAAALRIHPRENVADHAVLAGGVRRLKDDQESRTPLGVERPLPLANVGHGVPHPLPVIRLVLVHGGDAGRTAFKVGRLTRRYAEWGEIQAHDLSLAPHAPCGKDRLDSVL